MLSVQHLIKWFFFSPGQKKQCQCLVRTSVSQQITLKTGFTPGIPASAAWSAKAVLSRLGIFSLTRCNTATGRETGFLGLSERRVYKTVIRPNKEFKRAKKLE